MTSAIVDEAVRLITKYAEPMSLNRQYEINYENGASFTHKPWGHYPDECPNVVTVRRKIGKSFLNTEK